MPPKRAAVDDDEDDVPVQAPKKTTRKVVVDDDEDDAPALAVARSTKTRTAAQAEGEDDDDVAAVKAPVARRARVAEPSDSTEPNGTAPRSAARRHVAAAGTDELSGPISCGADELIHHAWVPPDYDAMTYQDFVEHLRSESKTSTLERKKIFDEILQQQEAAIANNAVEELPDRSPGGYTYKFMLRRIMDMICARNGGGGGMSQATIPSPVPEKIGTKRTAISNFATICAAVRRSEEDVQDFFNKQLSTQSSLDHNKCLIMKMQRVSTQQLENLLGKYVNEFVICNSCHSLDTDLKRDQNRLLSLRCNQCGATRFVSAGGAAQYLATTTKRAVTKAKKALL